MLLHRFLRGALIAKSSLIEPLQFFSEGNWTIFAAYQRQVREAGIQGFPRRKSQDDEVAKRSDRVQSFVQIGELSAARQALEGAAVARGTEATRAALTDPAKRPPDPREFPPRQLAKTVLVSRFDLDPVLFSQNLRRARRSAEGCFFLA